MKLNSICTLVIFAAAILTSCSSPIQPENLNGYWEIERVTLPDGTEKEYEMNMIADYIELDGTAGTRTKVQPQVDGTYINNGATEEFTTNTDTGLLLHYKTPYDSWTEEVLALSKDKMTVKNKDGKIFTYKTYIPFSLKTK